MFRSRKKNLVTMKSITIMYNSLPEGIFTHFMKKYLFIFRLTRGLSGLSVCQLMQNNCSKKLLPDNSCQFLPRGNFLAILRNICLFVSFSRLFAISQLFFNPCNNLFIIHFQAGKKFIKLVGMVWQLTQNNCSIMGPS